MPAHRRSARNLAHYLALRGRDVRTLQVNLARLGLSSLGRSEGHILASVKQVRRVVEQLAGQEPGAAPEAPVSFDQSSLLLAAKTEALFGPAPSGRHTRVMVTMPSEATWSYELVEDLVNWGMDCARINAAHDDPEAWAAMAGHVRRAAAESGRLCPVQIDLAGPKLRTVPVPGGWLATLELDGVIELCDARGRYRRLSVVGRSPGGAWVEAERGVKLESGVVMDAGAGRPGSVPCPRGRGPSSCSGVITSSSRGV